MSIATDTGTLLNGWLDDLDVTERAEAYGCLLTGVYSRGLLRSLRSTLSAGNATRHGLDDPHTADAGDPLSATIQTLLRDRLLVGDAPLRDLLLPTPRRCA